MNIMLEMLVATEKIHRPLQKSLSLGFEEAIGFVRLMLDAPVLRWRKYDTNVDSHMDNGKSIIDFLADN